jgi:magnesium and cobalt transporter
MPRSLAIAMGGAYIGRTRYVAGITAAFLSRAVKAAGRIRPDPAYTITQELQLEGGPESSLWQRITRFFTGRNNDSVEQAIIEASEEGELLQEEGSMLLSVLHLDDLQVQGIMTPRTDIICASVDSSLADIVELILSSGHSRIPVFKDTRDNIVGIIYAKDLLGYVMNNDLHATPLAAMMRPPFFVPETKNALALLHDFKSGKKHLAVILDEYGGTAGIVSIEDVLEQIVGDIEDEHDAPREEDIRVMENGDILLSGRASLEDIAEETGITIESDDVDTIGGYLLHVAGRVPQTGENFLAAGTLFTVTEADATQIRSIRARPTAPGDGENNAAGQAQAVN